LTVTFLNFFCSHDLVESFFSDIQDSLSSPIKVKMKRVIIDTNYWIALKKNPDLFKEFYEVCSSNNLSFAR